MELEMYRRYSQMARGIEKAELVFKNGRVFSSGTGEFIDGDVAVADGIVIGVGTYEGETEIDLEGKVICPGFIDSHLHLESTPIGAYAAVLVIAALAIAGGIFYKKKRKNDK